MKTKSAFFVLVALFSVSLSAQELPTPATLEDAVRTKDLVWNKWETENFIVLSLDYAFGNHIRSKIESRMVDVCGRWGLDGEDFPKKCKLVCVPDPKTLKKFFSLEFPKAEVRSKNGDMAIWIDSERMDFLDGLLASICLRDKPPYIKRGIPLAMLGPKVISGKIVALSSPSSKVASLKDEDFSKMNPEEKTVFDSESVAICLFLRREFGKNLFSRLLSKDSMSPHGVCGFDDAKSFDSSFSRYIKNLKEDIESGKTPDLYLSP